jgi:hypothetical protein
VTFAELKVDLIVIACAVSAGIHGALVPDHFHEGAGPGIGFVIATVLPAALAVVLTRAPSQETLLAAVVVFAGLIAAYAVVVVHGLPVLHPEREELDGLALFTKAVEAGGLLLAASLGRRPAPFTLLHPKGTLT